MELDDLRKLEFASKTGTTSLPDDAEVKAIVKVRQPSYVPRGVTVRARIDDTMFTVSCRAGTLRQLEQDPNVESIGLAQRLDIVEDE